MEWEALLGALVVHDCPRPCAGGSLEALEEPRTEPRTEPRAGGLPELGSGGFCKPLLQDSLADRWRHFVLEPTMPALRAKGRQLREVRVATACTGTGAPTQHGLSATCLAQNACLVMTSHALCFCARGVWEEVGATERGGGR